MTCICQLLTSPNIRQEHIIQATRYAVKSSTWNQKLKSWHESITPCINILPLNSFLLLCRWFYLYRKILSFMHLCVKQDFFVADLNIFKLSICEVRTYGMQINSALLPVIHSTDFLYYGYKTYLHSVPHWRQHPVKITHFIFWFGTGEKKLCNRPVWHDMLKHINTEIKHT
jgi:hypothetical protein